MVHINSKSAPHASRKKVSPSQSAPIPLKNDHAMRPQGLIFSVIPSTPLAVESCGSQKLSSVAPPDSRAETLVHFSAQREHFLWNESGLTCDKTTQKKQHKNRTSQVELKTGLG